MNQFVGRLSLKGSSCEDKKNVLGILSGESGDLFMRYFKEYLATMFEQYPRSIRKDVPKEFAANHLGRKSGGSSEVVDRNENANAAGGRGGELFEIDRV